MSKYRIVEIKKDGHYSYFTVQEKTLIFFWKDRRSFNSMTEAKDWIGREKASRTEKVVYSVTKDGKRSSTIAFRRWDNTEDWVFNQHYGYCNAYIEDGDEKEFKDIILNLLNDEQLEKVA